MNAETAFVDSALRQAAQAWVAVAEYAFFFTH
jgi:hypothetical protein